MATEFKSQICTTVEQSDRLLDLGLKPETPSMQNLGSLRSSRNSSRGCEIRGISIVIYQESSAQRARTKREENSRGVEVIGER